MSLWCVCSGYCPVRTGEISIIMLSPERADTSTQDQTGPTGLFISSYIYISKAFRTFFCCMLWQTPSSRMSLCNYMREILYFTAAAHSRWKTCKTQPCNCPILLNEEEKEREKRDRGRGETQCSCISCLLCGSPLCLSFLPPGLSSLWQSQWLQSIGLHYSLSACVSRTEV